MIRAAPKPGINLKRTHRRLHNDPKSGEPATFEEIPRRCSPSTSTRSRAPQRSTLKAIPKVQSNICSVFAARTAGRDLLVAIYRITVVVRQ